MVIGLAGAMVIRYHKVSNKFENISGRDSGQDSKISEIPENNMGYYQGVLGMYYMAHTRGSSGRDLGRVPGRYRDCTPPWTGLTWTGPGLYGRFLKLSKIS
jgi:hypothetical protein